MSLIFSKTVNPVDVNPEIDSKYEFKKVRSTNDIALKKIKSGIRKGIVLTETQTKGRGQYGKKWISLKGNLFISFFNELNKTKLSINAITKINLSLIHI